jgi:hypothetical protein
MKRMGNQPGGSNLGSGQHLMSDSSYQSGKKSAILLGFWI